MEKVDSRVKLQYLSVESIDQNASQIIALDVIFAQNHSAMKDQVRVRFAPSPTGPLHVGGLRTALFNYLFAKQHGGAFILRIEDTDQKRYVAGAEDYIIKALDWCHIPADESPTNPGAYGPYRQSERQDIYTAWAHKLVQQGSAYYAFDSNEELEALRREQETNGQTFVYNFNNRATLTNGLNMSKASVQQRINSGDAYVIRFKAPHNRLLKLQDQIRGTVAIDCNTLDDKILYKSDGMPTYHLANVIDDHLMKITHVIRGEEWLPSLALHVLLYEAFGWNPPEFAHLPLILKPSGNGKLSKRDGDKLGFPVFPIDWEGEIPAKGFKGAGYLPEALINFLGLLGWNPGTEQELFSLTEMTKAFSLSSVNKGGARFDIEKLNWFNQQYLAKMAPSQLAPILKKSFPFLNNFPESQLNKVVALTQDRLVFIDDFWSAAGYFFKAPNSFDEKALKRIARAETSSLIDRIIAVLSTYDETASTTLQEYIKNWISSNNIGFGAVMQPLRLALVGDLKGPDVFDIITILGRKEACQRMAFLQSKL